MALRFRLSSSRRQKYLGVQCDPGEQLRMAERLTEIGLGWTRALARMARDGKGAGHEIYVADLSDWPNDLRDYGVNRLRADLVAAGFEDRT